MKRGIIFFIILIFCFAVSMADQFHDDADRFWNEGQKLKRERIYAKAIEMFKRAVVAERKSKEPRGEELTNQLKEIADIYGILGDFQSSLHYHKLCLKISRESGNRHKEFMSLQSIGRTLHNLKRYDEALENFNDALAVASTLTDKNMLVAIHNDMSGTYRIKGDFDDALKHYRDGLEAAKKIGNKTNIAAMTSNLGTMYYYNKQFDRALECYITALDIDREITNDEHQSTDFSNIGTVYIALGRYGEAFNYFEQALDLDRSSGDKRKIASRLNMMGSIYFRTGDNKNAIDNYNESLEINRSLNNTMNVGQLLCSIGEVYDSMGKYNAALDYYIRALSINKELESQENIKLRLSDIGMAYEMRYRYDDAYNYLEKALMKNMAFAKKDRIAANLCSIGRVMISLKNYSGALDNLNQSLVIYREIGDTLSEADNLKNIAVVHFYTEKYAEAAVYCSRGLEVLSGMKTPGSLKSRNIENDLYQWLIAAYARDGKHDSAFESADIHAMKKACSVFPEEPLKNIPEQLKSDEIRKLIPGNSAVIVYSNMSWDNPIQILLTGGGSLSSEMDKVEAVKDIYNAMGRDIELFMSIKKDDTIYKPEEKTRRDYYYLEFQKILNFYRHLVSKKYISNDEDKVLSRLSRKLYIFLFSKVEKLIDRKEILYIRPDGELSAFPFETLIMPDGRFMAERYSIRYAYSSSQLRPGNDKGGSTNRGVLVIEKSVGFSIPRGKDHMASQRQYEMIRKSVMDGIIAGASLRPYYGWFGNFDFKGLQYAGMEVAGMGGGGADKTASDNSSTESGIKSLSGSGTLAGYRIVHFIGNALVVPEIPELSALIVPEGGAESGEDGILNAREISRLKMNADCVTLSHVSLSDLSYHRGEGIWQLCSAFSMAGAGGVLISTWMVDDIARIIFFKKVYGLVREKGLSFSEAVSQAKRLFINGKIDVSGFEKVDSVKDEERIKKYASPYYWGSYFFYGY